MNAFFVTGTGTGIGKTLVTCALARQLRQKGKSVRVLKPIVSGFDPANSEDSDPHLILRALGEPASGAAINAISPWRYTAPMAPDQAAALEGREINYNGVIEFCREAMKSNENYLLIEGVGGAFVPLAGDKTVADWIGELGIPSIVVTGNYLGTLSHTLSLLDAMHARNLEIAHLVVNDCSIGDRVGDSHGDRPLMRDTLAALAPFTIDVMTSTIPQLSPSDEPWRQVPSLPLCATK